MKSIFPILACCLLCFVLSCGNDDDGATTPRLDDRDQFLGTYSVDENCQGSTDEYTTTISSVGGNSDRVIITDLFVPDTVLDGIVTGNRLTLSSQETQGLTFSGSGTLNGRTLTLSFSVSLQGQTANCTAIMTK